MTSRIAFTILFCCMALLTSSQTATQKTFLVPNLEMHTGKIRSISTDAANRYLLTCSIDKTAKLWNAANGQLLKTLRVPIANGNEGMLYAGTLSPDGKMAAIGGWSSDDEIYLLSIATGNIVRTLPKHGGVINSIQFSTDGNFLAAALGGGAGFAIWDTRTWNKIENPQHQDFTEACYGIAFNPKGGLAVTSFDGSMRLYSANFQLKKTIKQAQTEPFGISFSPNGQLLAVGFDRARKLDVYDANTLQWLYSPDLSGIAEDEDLANVIFNSNNQLAAGGTYQKRLDGAWKRCIRLWEDAGKGSFTDIGVAGNTIMGFVNDKKGGFSWCGFQPDWGHITNKQADNYHGSLLPDMAAKDDSHLRISQTGEEIGATPLGKKPFMFNVVKRQASWDEQSYEAAFTANTGSISVKDWDNNDAVTINGKIAQFLKKNESCKSVDIDAPNNKLVFGASYNLYCLDATGKTIWETPSQATIFAANISGNGKTVVAAFADGMLRWYSMANGALLLTLMALPETQQWVLYTPSGYYDCSPGAENLMGWHVNQGQDKEAAFYPLSRFRNVYYRPDVMDRILVDYDEANSLAYANANRKQPLQPTNTNITKTLPPTISITNLREGDAFTQRKATLKYSITSPNGEPITDIKVRIDGGNYVGNRGIKLVSTNTDNTLEIELPEKDCKLLLFAENKFGWSEPAMVNLKWAGNTAIQVKVDPSIFQPKLYALVVGISSYDNADFKLQFAAKDATDFNNALLLQKGQLYKDVQIKLLTDKAATKDNILDGLDWLQQQATNKDVVVLYFAGHGINDATGNFYYLPVGADMNAIRRSCLPYTDIKSALTNLPCKVLLFADACHSGNIMGTRRGGPSDMAGYINDLVSAENGVIVFTSSTGKEYSLEDPAWQNGAFTKAIVEGLKGKAELAGYGKITISSLNSYLTERVKELTKGNQHPKLILPEGISDFPFATIKK